MQGHSVAGNSRERSVTSREVESCPWSPQGRTSLPGVQVPPGPSAWQRGKQVLSCPALPRDQLLELHCLRLLYSPAGWC